MPEKQFAIFALAGIPAVDAQGRRTGTERSPGEAARGHTVPPTCPACGTEKAPRPVRGTRDDAGLCFLSEKDPQTSLLHSPLPKAADNPPTTPHPAAAASRARALRGPAGACRGSATRPPDACASPVPGAVKSRTPVTWIFTRQEAAAPPSLPARSDRHPRSTLWSEHTVPVSWPVTHSSLRRAPARFSETRRGLPKGL